MRGLGLQAHQVRFSFHGVPILAESTAAVAGFVDGDILDAALGILFCNATDFQRFGAAT